MSSSIVRALAVAGLAIALPMLVSSNGGIAASRYECFTDDGYGRKFPCSARYKRENPAWRQSNQCFTDEGNGRYRPCDSFFKRTQR